jgi:hypothetical protein
MQPGAQRISVSDTGITVTSVTEPLISMYGNEMRPGHTASYDLPWAEIARVSLSMLDVPEADLRWLSMDIDLTWGEFLTVDERAEGFSEAVTELARRSGLDSPDLAALDSNGFVLWTMA